MTAIKVQGRFAHLTPQGTSFKDVLEIDNDEDVNDIHIYSFPDPDSFFSSPPDLTDVKITLNGASGKPEDDQLIKQVGGMSQGYTNGENAVAVRHIKPALKKGDKITVELGFKDGFEKGEGYVIYLTQDGKTLTPSKEEMKIAIPTGPSKIETVLEAAKLAGSLVKPLISKAEEAKETKEEAPAKAAAVLIAAKLEEKPRGTIITDAEPLKTRRSSKD